jgi:hypothetical protein
MKGFYLIGFFTKGEKSQFDIQTKRPFKTDENGFSMGVAFRGVRRTQFPKEWFFFENRKISDLNKELELRKSINLIWQEWCKKHNRKAENILEE